MVIELLLNYEVKEMERPVDMAFGLHLVPNFSAKISIRHKGDSEK